MSLHRRSCSRLTRQEEGSSFRPADFTSDWSGWELAMHPGCCAIDAAVPVAPSLRPLIELQQLKPSRGTVGCPVKMASCSRDNDLNVGQSVIPRHRKINVILQRPRIQASRNSSVALTWSHQPEEAVPPHSRFVNMYNSTGAIPPLLSVHIQTEITVGHAQVPRHLNLDLKGACSITQQQTT